MKTIPTTREAGRTQKVWRSPMSSATLEMGMTEKLARPHDTPNVRELAKPLWAGRNSWA